MNIRRLSVSLFLTDSMKFGTYLIAEILESESEKLTLRHPRDAEVEPSAIVLSVHVRARIARHPDVEVIFLVASDRSAHIPTAKLTTKHDL